MSDDLMTLPQVAEYLGICRRTVFRLIKNENIPAKKLGGKWYVPRAGLKKLLGVPEESPVQP